MVTVRSVATVLFVACISTVAAAAPKLDKETCAQLKVEQAKFVESGIVSDIQRGPDWAKSNLSAERLREIEHFILLDEHLKFGCREVTLTVDALRAGEAARQIELNPTLEQEPPGVPPSAQSEPQNEGGAAAPPGQTAPARTSAPTPKPKPRADVTLEEKPAAAAAQPKPKAAAAKGQGAGKGTGQGTGPGTGPGTGQGTGQGAARGDAYVPPRNQVDTVPRNVQTGAAGR